MGNILLVFCCIRYFLKKNLKDKIWNYAFCSGLLTPSAPGFSERRFVIPGFGLTRMRPGIGVRDDMRHRPQYQVAPVCVVRPIEILIINQTWHMRPARTHSGNCNNFWVIIISYITNILHIKHFYHNKTIYIDIYFLNFFYLFIIL